MKHLACAVAIALAASAAFAADLARWNFETGTEGWVSPDAQAIVTTGPGAAADSKALLLKFRRVATAEEAAQRGDVVGGAFVQLPEPLGQDAAGLRLTVRTKLLTPLMVAVIETNGAMYNRVVTVPPGQWHNITLPLSTFRPDEGSADKDPDRRLTPSQIGGLGVADISFMLVRFAAEAQKQGFRVPTPQAGDNEIAIDEIALVDTAPAPISGLIEDAASGKLPGLLLFPAAGVEISRQQAGPDGKPCWAVSYRLQAGQLFPLLWGTPGLPASPGLHVRLGAESSAMLLLLVKEEDGSEYNTAIELAAGQMIDRLIPWPDFRLADNSADENGKLDLDQVREITLVDLSAMLWQQSVTNTLYIGKLAASQ